MQINKLFICYLLVIPIAVISAFPYQCYQFITDKQSEEILEICRTHRLDSMGIVIGIHLLILSLVLLNESKAVLSDVNSCDNQLTNIEVSRVKRNGRGLLSIGIFVLLLGLYKLYIGIKFWFFLYFPAW